MTFPILGGNSAVDGYVIDNSLRFNDDDANYLVRTPSSAGNRRTWTFSVWTKRGRTTNFFSAGTLASDEMFLAYDGNSRITYLDRTGGTNPDFYFLTQQQQRDFSAWWHLVLTIDTTQPAASNRVKLYINGERVTVFNTITYAAQNYQSQVNTTTQHFVGRRGFPGMPEYFDGYMADVYFIDGQSLDPTSFGEYDDSGIWKPIEYSGSYGTNGFYLDFENSGSLGADQSGNGNNFTPINLASTDQMQDTPTNNFCTMNQLHRRGTVTFAQGNLRINLGSSSSVAGTHSVNSGKWYFEAKLQSGSETMVGWINPDISTFYTGNTFAQAGNVLYYSGNGHLYKYGGSSPYGASYSAGTIIGCALDLDNNQVTFYKNGVSQGAASINAGNYIPYLIAGGNSSNWSMCFSSYDFSVASGNSDANGYGNFEYAPPSGYLAWCTQNIATELPPTIDDGSQYFNTVLWTGNGSTRSITGVGFQPDWVWIKGRSTAQTHRLFDSSRGTLKNLLTNGTNAEATTSSSLTSFNSDGFTIGTFSEINQSSRTYVGWNWKVNGGTTSSNTDGSITSTVQANTTAGFSIVTYTGNGSTATVGHGLGVAPSMIITKKRSNTSQWAVYTKALGPTGSLFLNTTGSFYVNSIYWNNTNPTNAVWTMKGQDEGNADGQTYVAYCFAEIEGYSKFGKYTGNGSTDGAFIYTGFRPAFVLFKSSSINGENWVIQDSTRDSYNLVYHRLDAERTSAENTTIGSTHPNIDIVSNGFKHRGGGNVSNGSGATYIYMAFAENPFYTSTAVAGTAR